MAIALAELVAPGGHAARAAVVTSEIQNGVVGNDSALPSLAEAARSTMVPAVARLVAAARSAGAHVVHCTFARRPDGLGANGNARLFAATARATVQQLAGTPAVEVVEAVGVAPGDLVLTRTHGVGPMGGTDLDPVLRNLGVTTIVVAGVSVNVAITNLVMDAVNHGYQVVLPRDAVCGVPADYADAVIDNTLALLATVTTTDEIAAAWAAPGHGTRREGEP
jgi:nicotinamidase-related amidase